MYSLTLKDLIEKTYLALQDYLNLPTKEAIKQIDWSNVKMVLTTVGIWVILMTFSAFMLWLIRAIGLYKMAKKNNDKFAFLAFIPYGSMFVMGRIIGKTKLYGIDIDYPEYVLPALLFTMALPFTSSLSTILFTFFYYGILYKLYKLKWKGFAAIATILSIFVPVIQPFFVFFNHNHRLSRWFALPP